MRTAKDGNGERLFSYEDFLTSQQISSYFSRFAAKRSVEVDQSDSEDETPGEDFQSVLSDMTPTTSVSWCQTPSLVHFLYHCCGVSVNLLVLTYRKLQSKGKSHVWPCSQTWYKAVAVASARNCIRYLVLSYPATKRFKSFVGETSNYLTNDYEVW